MSHLLVTNDFPPKVGGIQTYLWELWRRLPEGRATILTTPHPQASEWDAAQPFPIHRVREPLLVPRPAVAERIRGLAVDTGAKLVVLDPALPIGLIGPDLGLPYVVVLHGAEVTVPARLPLARALLGKVLCGARGIIAAGSYPVTQAVRLVGRAGLPEIVEIPPGVDLQRFRPRPAADRVAIRERLGLPAAGPLVVSASRLVPRKGLDVLVEATPRLIVHRPDLVVAVAGAGREAARLRTLAGRLGVKVRFLGRLSDVDLADLNAAADVFVMLCRDRWAGLEQEGFGMVFLEAAASGVPQVAGDSGGSTEAVLDGVTGLVVRRPDDPEAAAAAIATILDDADLRQRMGAAGRRRAEAEFAWEVLALRLDEALTRWEP